MTPLGAVLPAQSAECGALTRSASSSESILAKILASPLPPVFRRTCPA